MKQFSFIKISLLLMCCTSILASAMSQAATVRVAGVVTNETRRAGAAGVKVELFRVAKNARQQQTAASVRTDAKGRFDCGPLNLGTDDLLIARANWQGNFYDQAWVYEASGQLKSMQSSIAPGQMKLMVYDATTKAPPLGFQVHHLAISAKEHNLSCIERIVVLNPSRTTFIGEGEQHVSVRLSLPAGARDVKMDPDVEGKLVKTSDGYGIVKPIVPSQQDERNILKNNVVIINYTMNWPLSLPWSRHIDLSRKVLYPTNMFFVVREETDRNLEINAPQLGKDQTEEINTRDGMQARIVNMTGGAGGGPMSGGPMSGGPMSGGPALKPGDVMTIRVARPLNPLVWVFMLFVVALCLLVPLSLVNRQRGSASAGNGTGKSGTLKSSEPTDEASVYRGTPIRAAGAFPVPESLSGADFALSDEARRLIEAIAKLDDGWESGSLTAEQYQSERAVWKKRLIDLLDTKTSG